MKNEFIIIIIFVASLLINSTSYATSVETIGVNFKKNSKKLSSTNKFWINKYLKRGSSIVTSRNLTLDINFYLESKDSVYSIKTTELYSARAASIVSFVRLRLNFQGEIRISYLLRSNVYYNKALKKEINCSCMLDLTGVIPKQNELSN